MPQGFQGNNKPKLSLPVPPPVKNRADSIYRRYYNSNLPFFCWTFDVTEGPYVVKLHINCERDKNLTNSSIKKSIIALFDKEKDPTLSIDINYFVNNS